MRHRSSTRGESYWVVWVLGRCLSLSLSVLHSICSSVVIFTIVILTFFFPDYTFFDEAFGKGSQPLRRPSPQSGRPPEDAPSSGPLSHQEETLTGGSKQQKGRTGGAETPGVGVNHRPGRTRLPASRTTQVLKKINSSYTSDDSVRPEPDSESVDGSSEPPQQSIGPVGPGVHNTPQAPQGEGNLSLPHTDFTNGPVKSSHNSSQLQNILFGSPDDPPRPHGPRQQQQQQHQQQEQPHSTGGSVAGDKMAATRHLSLLERKKKQWEEERAYLNGGCGFWGRAQPPETQRAIPPTDKPPDLQQPHQQQQQAYQQQPPPPQQQQQQHIQQAYQQPPPPQLQQTYHHEVQPQATYQEHSYPQPTPPQQQQQQQPYQQQLGAHSPQQQAVVARTPGVGAPLTSHANTTSLPSTSLPSPFFLPIQVSLLATRKVLSRV
ncbi:putative uncharacterized protein DDB_G0271606 [Homarus americanus]|uniref:putative uncharacterized protein DDB_G0271606 n=1 Tax=Homarus americanus TaxID=6706 RepID=UPI001C4474F3|nr:putative uncharacterized protein DDB_G0271606 [Homarus americanus]